MSLVLLSWPATAGAQAVRDSIVAAGVSTLGNPFAGYVTSGPDGEDPVGRLVIGGGYQNAEGPVTCFRVNGGLATIGYEITRSRAPEQIGTGMLVYAQDNGSFTNGAAVDSGNAYNVAEPPATCPPPDSSLASVSLLGEVRISNDDTDPVPVAREVAIGTGQAGTSDFKFGAIARPDGSDPLGFAQPSGSTGGQVTCLRVSGSTADLGVDYSGATPGGARLRVFDGGTPGEAGDTFAFSQVSDPSTADCSPLGATPSAVNGGGIVVHDQLVQCSDGIDNDGDGRIDFGSAASNDRGCSSATDNTELSYAFGKADAGGNFSPMSRNVKRASRFFTIQAPHEVVRLRAYMDGLGATAGSQTVRGVMYIGDDERPRQLVGQTEPVTVHAGDAGRWIDLPFETPVITGGWVWLGLHTGTDNGVARYAWFHSGLRRYNIDRFSDLASDPFGDSFSDGQTMSVFALGDRTGRR